MTSTVFMDFYNEHTTLVIISALVVFMAATFYFSIEDDDYEDETIFEMIFGSMFSFLRR